jgi:hypothetical protein
MIPLPDAFLIQRGQLEMWRRHGYRSSVLVRVSGGSVEFEMELAARTGSTPNAKTNHVQHKPEGGGLFGLLRLYVRLDNML